MSETVLSHFIFELDSLDDDVRAAIFERSHLRCAEIALARGRDLAQVFERNRDKVSTDVAAEIIK